MTQSPYTPSHGDTVHLRRDNCWQLPSGRYTLRESIPGGFELQGESNGIVQAVYLADLAAEEADYILTRISPEELASNRRKAAAELARNTRLADLGSRSPMRGQRCAIGFAAPPQEGTASLPLFGTVQLI